MRPLSRLFACALAVALAAGTPLRAGMVEMAPMARAFEVARANPAFHAELVRQVGIATSLSVQPHPSFASMTAPTISAGPWTPQAARLISAYLSQPVAAAPAQQTVAAVLGPEVAAQLQQAAQTVQEKRAANPGLDAELKRMTKDLDFTDHAAVQTFTAALFDNAKIAPAAADVPAVAVPEGPGRGPAVHLTKATPRLMNAAQLAEYVEKNKVVSPEKQVRLSFGSGQYHPEYEAELVALGVHRVNVVDPTREEVTELANDAHGFRVVTDKVRWVMTTRTMDEHKEALKDKAFGGSNDHAKRFAKALEKSHQIRTSPPGILTVADWNKWYDVYERNVVGVNPDGTPYQDGVDEHGKPIYRRQGRRAVARDMGKGAELTDEFFRTEGWYVLLYHDEHGKVIGGDIYKAIPERGIFVNGYAAYDPELKPFNPATLAFEVGNKLAAQAGYKVFSFGMDTNEYGHEYSLGLMQNKSSFLLQPFGEGQIMLSKIINTERFAAHTDNEGRTLGYGFFGPSEALLREYYAFRAATSVTKTADQFLGRTFRVVDGVVRAANGLSSPEATVFHYFHGTAPALKTPRGTPIVKGTLAAPTHRTEKPE